MHLVVPGEDYQTLGMLHVVQALYPVTPLDCEEITFLGVEIKEFDERR